MNVNVSITAESINSVLETAKPFLLGYAIFYCLFTAVVLSFIGYVAYKVFSGMNKRGF